MSLVSSGPAFCCFFFELSSFFKSTAVPQPPQKLA
jgi:hypothetical protein